MRGLAAVAGLWQQRQPSRWIVVSRNMQATVDKWVHTPASVILVRGHRRVGKSTIVTKSLEMHRKPFVTVYIASTDTDTLRNFQDKFQDPHVSLMQVGLKIAEKIQQGYSVVLEEMQNASSGIQISLQQGIDHLVYWSHTVSDDKYRRAGSLFLLGSISGMLDAMIESRKAALYQRVATKITILPFNTQEIYTLFSQYGLSNCPWMMLCLHTLFGGIPYGYYITHKAGLLHDQASRDAIVKKIFSSETPDDAEQFLTTTALGLEMAKICSQPEECLCEALNTSEECHFASWVCEIAQDRWLLCKAPCLPIPNVPPAPVYIAPRIHWNIDACKIDFLGSVPSHKLLVVGSCKRSVSKVCTANLAQHWSFLESQWSSCKQIPSLLSTPESTVELHEEWSVLFVHFVVDTPSRDHVQRVANADHHICSLCDMLNCF